MKLISYMIFLTINSATRAHKISHGSDFLFLKDFIYFYREGKGESKKGRETLICDMRCETLLEETSVGDLSYSPGSGTKLATQACDLTRNWRSTFCLWEDVQPIEPHWSGLISWHRCAWQQIWRIYIVGPSGPRERFSIWGYLAHYQTGSSQLSRSNL